MSYERRHLEFAEQANVSIHNRNNASRFQFYLLNRELTHILNCSENKLEGIVLF